MDDQETLFEAIKTGDEASVERLLARSPDLALAETEDGVSAVLLAAYYRRPHIAAVLAEHRNNLNIFEAAALGKLSMLRRLLDEQPGLANAYALDGFQPLGLACFFGHPQAAQLLLEHGAAVNSASRNEAKVMPLHSAVAARQLEVARILLARGANPNAVQAGEFTPLHGAAENGQVEMVRLLLDHGANPHQRAADGRTALDIAREKGHPEVIALLESLQP